MFNQKIASVLPSVDKLAAYRNFLEQQLPNQARFVDLGLALDAATQGISDTLDDETVSYLMNYSLTSYDTYGQPFSFRVRDGQLQLNSGKIYRPIGTVSKMEDGDWSFNLTSDDELNTIIESLLERIETATAYQSVAKACNLMISGNYSASNLYAATSDIFTLSAGYSRSVVDAIVDTVDPQYPQTLCAIIDSLFNQLGSVHESTDGRKIAFESTDFEVKGWTDVIVENIVPVAATVVTAVAAVVAPAIGFAVGIIGNLISSIWTSAKSTASEKATINKDSTYRYYAQPIFQFTFTLKDIAQSWVRRYIQQQVSANGSIKFACPGFDFFIWNSGSQYSAEGFLRLEVDRTPSYALISKTDGSDGIFIGSNDETEYALDAWIGSISNGMTLDESDDVDQRRFIISSLNTALYYLSGFGTAYGDHPYFSLGSSDFSTDDWKYIQAYRNICYAGPTDSGVAEWSSIVGFIRENGVATIVPLLMKAVNSKYYPSGDGVAATFSINNIANLIGIDVQGNPITDLNSADALYPAVTITRPSGKGDYYLIPPQYEPGSHLVAILTLATAAVATFALAKVGKFFLKRAIARRVASLRVKTAAAYDRWVSNPTSANWKAFYRQSSWYNRFSRITGYSPWGYSGSYMQTLSENYDNLLATMTRLITGD